MKISTKTLDRLIIFLLGYIVLVDMVNGAFLMEDIRLPISQGTKFIILGLFLVRLSVTRDLPYVLLLIVAFQVSPILGLIRNGDISAYFQDLVFGAKWVNVPISYLYFKALFKSEHFSARFTEVRRMLRTNLGFLSLNMILGALGFGMSFYYHGYANAVGTKGFIYAGNELTILVLSLYFIIACYIYYLKQYRNYLLLLLAFLGISFLITSKTVLAGVLLVFFIPVLGSLRYRIKKAWIDRISAAVLLGTPLLAAIMYIGITKSGVIDKIQYSLKRNDFDILTVVLSNRNRFVSEGWEVFSNEFSWFGKFMGYGQQHHLNLSGHSAEVDFFSLLFASGIFGLLVLFLLILYWLINAQMSIRTPGHVFARSTWMFLLFLIVVSNLAGHIFGSGIAGIFIGMALAMMHFKPETDV